MKKTAEAVFNDFSYLFSLISSLNKKTVANALANAVKCDYINTFEEVFTKIRNVESRVVLVLGAGDLYEIVLSKLKNG